MNCTIPIRDAIDFALGGRLRAETEGLDTSMTYRTRVMPLVREDQALSAVMILGMGAVTDRPLTAWEDVFLPSVLGDRLATLTVPSEVGDRVPLVRAAGSPSVGRNADGNEPSPATPGWLVTGLLVSAALLVSGTQRASGMFGNVFMLLATGWLAASGLVGVFLTWLSLVANQPASDWNQNLLVANPVSLVVLERMWAFRLGASTSDRHVLGCIVLLLVGVAAATWLHSFPNVAQANGQVLALAVPAHLGLAWATSRRINSKPEAVGGDLRAVRGQGPPLVG